MAKKVSLENVSSLSNFSLSFDEKDYPLVFEKMLGIFRYGPLLSSFLFTLIVYLLGFLVSIIFNFSILYLKTYLFFHIALAIFLAYTIIVKSKKEIIIIFESVHPCFSIDNDSYDRVVKHWMNTLFNKKGFWITYSFLFILIVWGMTSFYYPYPFIDRLLGWLAGAPFKEVLIPEWFIGDRLPKLVLIIAMLLVGSLPFGLGIWASVVFTSLMNKMVEMPVIPIPGVLTTLLRKPTELFLQVSLIWFILTASSGITLFHSFDIYSGSFLLFISTGGLLAFFLPQIAFHRLVSKSHQNFTKLALEGYFKLEKENTNNKKNKELIDFCNGISEPIKPKDLWVFNFNDIFFLILGEILSLMIGLFRISAA